MKVGIGLDVRRTPGDKRSWDRIYDFNLSLCIAAETAGLDSVWLSEHHGFPDGYLPQPLTFAAAVAARTTRIRIGTALLIAPLRAAAHIAEEAAVVDLLSSGRLELGMGPGYRHDEFDLFAADLDARHRTTRAQVTEIRRLWREGVVTPPPFRGEVPIWLGYRGPIGAKNAGRLGTGLLSLEVEALEPYLAGLAEAGHSGAVARMTGAVHGFVSEDPERDWPQVSKHLAYWADEYRRLMVAPGDPAPRPIDPNRWRERGLVAGLGGFAYGTPAELAATLRSHFAGAPVETVFFEITLGGMSESMSEGQLEQVAILAQLLRDG